MARPRPSVRSLLSATLGLILGLGAGCGRPTPAPAAGAAPAATTTTGTKTALALFHAGSLSVPLRTLSDEFSRRHPGVTVQAEAAGSRETARKVSDLKRPCDVLASADYQVVDSLLLPDYAAFNVHFATNEMIIAYTERSRHAAEITAANWGEVLLRDDVNVGRADPNSDPCGYRTEMVFQLLEKYARQPGLGAKLIAKHGQQYVRPKETDLLALLEAGEIDYLPIYHSVASQHHLKFLALPDEVNLKAAKFADLYATATVTISGKNPGETMVQKGAAIVYSVTIPKNAEHRDLAIAYVELLLSPAGQKIMAEAGQGPLAPALTREFAALPEALKPYCRAIE